MIAVIADDITGGAEIAGIGLRNGLSVELSTSSDIPVPDVALWVVSTDTRSMNRDEATKVTAETVRNLRAAGIQDIFKKTDSVLRGHVVAELAAQLREEGRSMVVLCPANPRAGRKIAQGIYLIDGMPLHETGFSRDPDFPVTTSSVKEILKNDMVDEHAIKITDAESEDDLHRAAQLKDDDTVLAGSAAFFTAYLESLKFVPVSAATPFPGMNNAFYVCGSTYDKSRLEVAWAAANGASVVYFSPLILDTPDFEGTIAEYTSGLIASVNNGEKTILAVGDPLLKGRTTANKISDALAKIVKGVLSGSRINELVIEGGATASAIFEKLNFTRFTPTHEFAHGVVRMEIIGEEGLHVTIKPGSYTFPERVWNFKK